MRINKENRMQGLIDGDYCLQIAHNMLDVFNQAEAENEGFNSLEMLTIKCLFDDIFENTIKSNYKDGRNEVMTLLSDLDLDQKVSSNKSDRNVIDLFEALNKNH